MPGTGRSFRGRIGRSEGRGQDEGTSAWSRENGNVPSADPIPAVTDVFAWSPAPRQKQITLVF